MKIQWKIFFSLFAIVGFLFIVVAVTYQATTKVTYFRNRSLEVEGRLLSATNLRAQVRNQLLETFDVLYVSGIAEHERQITDGKVLIQKRADELRQEFSESNFIDTAPKSDIDGVINSYMQLQNVLDQGVDLYKNGQKREAQLKFIEAREKHFQNDFLKKVTLLIEQESQINKTEAANLEKSIQLVQKILNLSVGASLVLALLLSTFVARSIGRRLSAIEKAAQKMAARDFDITLPIEGSDEVATLSKEINTMAATLLEAKNQIVKQQELLLISSKMSSLGEMASGIAHEINTPLAVISLRATMLKQLANGDNFSTNAVKIVNETCDITLRTVARIAKIISGLRAFSRDGSSDPFEDIGAQVIVQETLDLCGTKFREHGIDLQVHMPETEVILKCRSTQISQVLLNLLNNSFDAIQDLPEKWIKLEVLDLVDKVELSVTDSGHGIAPEIRSKLAQPFFTTKDVGKGTGLGLSISRGIVMSHKGQFFLDEQNLNTRFVVVLPKHQS